MGEDDEELITLIKNASQEGQFHKISTENMESIYDHGIALTRYRSYDKPLLNAVAQFKEEIENRRGGKTTVSQKHQPGTYNIIKEHKFIISALVILFGAYVCKGMIHNDIVIAAAIVSVFIFIFSLFFELGHSRFLIFQLIGRMAWYIAILGALLTGWKRWIDLD